MCLAIPGLLTHIEGEDLQRRGLVRFGAVQRQVNLALTPEAQVNDYVIVHVGCAINIVDRDEAEGLLSLLRQAVAMEDEREIP